MILIPFEEYNSLKETAYLLKGPNRGILLKSIAELEQGGGIKKDLIEEWNWFGRLHIGKIIYIGKK